VAVLDRQSIVDLFGIELPIIQAPMAGASTPQMAIAVSEAGGLGSLPAALYLTTGLCSSWPMYVLARADRSTSTSFAIPPLLTIE